MEQFITDWFVEIIVFCLTGLFIISIVLRSLRKKNEERRELQNKHYIEETNKKLYDDIVGKTSIEPVVKKRIYNVQISINNSIVFKNNYKVELPTDARLLADNDATHISKENRKYIIRLIK
jgi:hypothetical protein